MYDVEAVVREHRYPLRGVASEERVRQHILNAYRCWGEPDPMSTRDPEAFAQQLKKTGHYFHADGAAEATVRRTSR